MSLDGALDGDTSPDAPHDTGPADMSLDGGRGMAATCEACSSDHDCVAGSYCAPLGHGIAGMGCLPSCIVDLPNCPARFSCIAGFVGTISSPLCAPVGDRCCVDPDGDLYGQGIGCLGTDCDETSAHAAMVHMGANEVCNGIDDNCNGMIDEGDPATICPHGTHVAGTVCSSGACNITLCENGWGDCNHMSSDGCETNIDTPTDCGGCGMACNLPNSTAPTCSMGSCVVGVCNTGFGDCDHNAMNGCEQMLNTASNCGACGTMCSAPNATTSCSTGSCAISLCDQHWGDCDGRISNGCERPLTTNTDCGMCSTICAPTSGQGDCSTGMCRVTTCASGFEDCDGNSANGCETNVRTLTNCGACGVTCSFMNASASCAAGACSMGVCNVGYGNCNGTTADGCETMTDTAMNCGGCGIACAPAHAVGSCSTGMCAIVSCNPGFADCNHLASDGCEVPINTLTDCGACGVACGRTNAVADCSTQTCRIGSCLSGYADCNNMDPDGCETSLHTLTSCGTCGVACARTNATPTCANGTCLVSTCNTGFGNCNGNDADGCEASLYTPANCGMCGTLCTRANASTTCPSGTCTLGACNTGFADCNGMSADGCEVDITTTSNCGMCGHACNLMHASSVCTAGACAIQTCAPGYMDCNLMASDGCETDIHTLANCGGCGMVCSFPNATAACGAGVCTFVGCSSSMYGNCNGSTADGCEAPLNTNTNCGGCGTTCSFPNAAASCPGGVCTQGACTSGFLECNTIAGDGCETPNNTLTNCGGCGTTCSFPNAAASCPGGVCTQGMCTSGFIECDANAANGCETPNTTLTNCGTCGNVCAFPHAGGACVSGTCGVGTCNTNYYDLNGVVSDGCECMDDSSSPSCSSGTPLGAAANPGMLLAGQSANASGMLPTAGSTDWYQVALPNPGTGHLHIAFSAGTGVIFDVYTTCSGAMGSAAGICSIEGGVATGLATYDFTNVGSATCTGACNTQPSWPATIYIQVRHSSPPPTLNSCMSATYTLALSR
jgi:hypothetical protein